jgi:DNA modification methylase
MARTAANPASKAWRLEMWPIDRPKDYPGNPRKIPEKATDKLAKLIKKFGFRQPLVCDENDEILVGHARRAGARKAGLTEIPVHVADDLSEADKRAYRLADNRVSEETGWNEEMLALELGVLDEMDFDLDFTGFDSAELTKLLASDEDVERAEETPEVPVNAVSVLGDVWVLGNHRLGCGDSTDAAFVEKVLAGVKPHLMVTDPPYGVEYDASKARAPTAGSAKGKVLNDDRADWSEAWALFPGSVAYVWHAMRFAGTVFDSLEKCGFEIRAEIVWAKSQLVMSRGHYHPQHESCWYAVREGASWSGDRTQTTLWKIDKPQKSETGHSTQKPIECMKRPIENNSSMGQAVYEPFSGSFTTGMACELTGRHCYAIELSPNYVDVGIQRWQNFTGQKAIHEETGKTFEELKHVRYDAAKDSRDSYDKGISALRKEHEKAAQEDGPPAKNRRGR